LEFATPFAPHNSGLRAFPHFFSAMNPPRYLLILSSLAGLTGVVCGAFGAHALRLRLTQLGTREAWQTAVHYHLLHAVALLALAALARNATGRLPAWIAGLWTAGIVLFSGSLYGLALGGPRALGPVTPLGGVAFISGWLCLFAWGCRASSAAQK